MTVAPQWDERALKDGVSEVMLESWRSFPKYIEEEFLDKKRFIYRGQASDKWVLESSLDRALRKVGRSKSPYARERHLEIFKSAVQGRRGANPPPLEEQNDWWALGQHHGLATPLLDWTESPFVALYFAFQPELEETKYRVVYGVSEVSLRRISHRVQRASKGKRGRGAVVEIVRILSDENSRKVNQSGLFLRGPDGVPIEEWIRVNCRDDTRRHLVIIKVPNEDRVGCLRYLNRMNINHLSLFPDLLGSSVFCNTELVIRDHD